MKDIVLNLKFDEKNFVLNIHCRDFTKINSFEDLIWWKKNRILNTFARKILEYQLLYDSTHLTFLKNITQQELLTNEILSSSVNRTFLNELYCNIYFVNNAHIAVGFSVNQFEDFYNKEFYELTKIYVYIHEKNCFYRIFSRNAEYNSFELEARENCGPKSNFFIDPDPINNKNLRNHIRNSINTIYKNEYIKIYNRRNINRTVKNHYVLEKVLRKLKETYADNFYSFSENNLENESYLTFYEKTLLKKSEEYFSFLKEKENINLYREIFRFLKTIDHMSIDVLYQFLVKKIFEYFSQRYDEKTLLKISLDMLILIVSNGLFKEKDMFEYLRKHDNKGQFLREFVVFLSNKKIVNIDQNLNCKICKYLLDKFSECYGKNIVNKMLLSVK